MKALQAARLDTKLSNHAFTLLRKLCGTIGHLPSSYLLSDKFDISGMPRASGGFSEIWMGVFKGEVIAVKSLRVSEVDDKLKIRKVGKQVTLSHPGSLIHRTAFLQRSGPMEAPVSSKRPQSHWGP